MNEKSELHPAFLAVPVAVMLTGQFFARKAGLLASGSGSLVNIFSMLSYFCLGLRGVVWIAVLRRMRLVFAYPVMSIGYLFVLVLSVSVFGETLTWANVSGAMLVTAGVVLVGIGEKSSGGENASGLS